MGARNRAMPSTHVSLHYHPNPLWGAVVLGKLVPGVALVYTRLPLANFLARLRRDAKHQRVVSPLGEGRAGLIPQPISRTRMFRKARTPLWSPCKAMRPFFARPKLGYAANL